MNTELHQDKKNIGLQNPVANSAMMLSCLGKPSPYTPIWLMRQAGRYMPAYRKIREKVGFLELCKNSDLSVEVTLMPVNEFHLDAAIIFADILLILEPLGAKLRFAAGDGPIIDNPIRTEADAFMLDNNSIIEPLNYVFSAISKTRTALDKQIPLIGFAGAPFTLAAYLIEGGKVGNLARTKTYMYNCPKGWQHLMNLLTASCTTYLLEQIKAGADIVQIFDSWLGYLSPSDFNQYVLPYSKKLVSALKNFAPVIYFGTDTSGLLKHLEQLQCQVIGLDWRVNLNSEWQKLNYQTAVQGNLDPLVLLSNKETIAQQTKRILQEAGGKPGHIFNLGHGVLPETPVDNVKYLVDLVHQLSRSVQP